MSIGGGVHRAIERACSIKCTAMQIFVKNNMQWFARPLERAEISAFLDHAAARRAPRSFRARELPDQSRGDQSAVSRQLAARAGGGTDPCRSTRAAVSGPASGRASRRWSGSRSREDRRIDRRSSRRACRKQKRRSRSKRPPARAHASAIDSSKSPTSSRTCVNRNGSAFASIPRTFSRPVTTLRPRRPRSKMFAEFDRIDRAGTTGRAASERFEDGAWLAGRSARAHRERKDRIGCVSFHHARPPFPKNPQSARDTERERADSRTSRI